MSVSLNEKISFLNDNKKNPNIFRKIKQEILDIIKSGNFNENDVDSQGNTPLMSACLNNNTLYNLDDIVVALIESGKSKAGEVNNKGETALIIASKNSKKTLILH